MAISLAVRTDISEPILKAYQEKLDNMNLHDLVKEFFSYLDYVEESDSGREFNPITIGSCRVLMSQPLDAVLTRLRKEIK